MDGSRKGNSARADRSRNATLSGEGEEMTLEAAKLRQTVAEGVSPAAKRRQRMAQGVSPGKTSGLVASPGRAAEFSVALPGLAFSGRTQPRAYALGYFLT